MKKISIMFLCFLMLIVVLIKWKSFQIVNKPIQQNNTIQPKSTPEPQPGISIAYGGKKYTVLFFTVTDASKLSLIENFTQKIGSTELIENNNCMYAINGGFYNTNNQPLGLWQNGDETIGTILDSRLFNGFIRATNNSVDISYTPFGNNRIILQTGPMLWFNDEVLPLQIRNDEYARRVVAYKTTDNEFGFMIIYDPESVYSGPLLEDLPPLLLFIFDVANKSIHSAINLDGGSASTFFGNGQHIQEFQPVGSLFCIK